MLLLKIKNTMWVLFSLFFIYLSIWIVLFLSSSQFNSLYLVIGVVISFIVAYLSLRLKFVSKKGKFLFLQFGFYRFIFNKVNNSFYYTVMFAYKILTGKSFAPLVDYIYLENDDIYETALLVNTLNMLPGVICMVVKRRYIVVYSVGYEYFIPTDIFLFNQDIVSAYDDSLV